MLTDSGSQEHIYSSCHIQTKFIEDFLRLIREHGIPFELKLEVPNNTTTAAIEEGRKMLSDPSAPRYSNMDALKAALEV